MYGGLGGYGQRWEDLSSDASSDGAGNAIVDCQNGMLETLSGIGRSSCMFEKKCCGNKMGREARAIFAQS